MLRIMKIHPQRSKTISKPAIQKGMVLISQEFWNMEELKRSVILVLEHDEEGTTGVILNKLSNLKLNQVIPNLQLDMPLYFGGPLQNNKIGFLHPVKSLPGVMKICKGIYWGGNVSELISLFKKEELNARDVRFFAGFAVWKPGELCNEIMNKKWWIDNFSFEQLSAHSDYDLWATLLVRRKNLYGLLHYVPDPVLN